MRTRFQLPFSLLAAAFFSAPAWSQTNDVVFNRDVRPILSAHCFACHGFDAKQRKADLRLDVAESALAPRDGAPAIKPGDLKASELWSRVSSSDPEVQMPPPSTKKPLDDRQKQILRRWIEQGAKYQKHWAFEPPVLPPLPAVKQENWVRTPVDRFILARLEREGLSPRKEAGRSILIRRVAFALTGLPPSPGEVAEFELDPAPNAYERMVDRYLQSPRYGEEMARHWLDVARYADTHGLHLDNERTMWAYRDWVIAAFNQNKRFDVFTVEQLAGDMLPQPTVDQLVATGFNRCNVTTSEGGSIEPEFLYRYAVERAGSTIQTWMGLTGGCAVCHDHKYDPLTSKEFYSFYAFFYSAADPAMDGNINTTNPYYKLPNEQQRRALESATAAEQFSRRRLEEAAAHAKYEDPAEKSPAQHLPIEDCWLDDVFPAGAAIKCSSRNASVWAASDELEPLRGRRSLKQFSSNKYSDSIDNPLQPQVVPANAKLSVSVYLDPHEPSEALMVEVGTARGRNRAVWGAAAHFGGEKSDPSWRGDLPKPGRWSILEIASEQIGLQVGDQLNHLSLHQFGGVAYWDDVSIRGLSDAKTDPRSSFSVWWKSRKGKDTPGVPADLATVLKDGPEKNPPADKKDRLLRFYLTDVARPATPELFERRRAWSDAVAAKTATEDAIPGTFIFKDLENPRPAYVMIRGQYDKPGEPVEPGVPAVFPPLKTKAGARPNRLDLARWLLAPEQPLTARVTVNRFWQQFFGMGLVKTSFDFGSQGEPPSHPELLDWLSVWHRENGWDVKSLVKMLVHSAAFRQESAVSKEVYQKDPENRLYARGPRFRLDAEQLRDNALFVSGLINLEMGGRGVKPYQPPNIWEPVGYSDSNTRFYLQDHGPALYRRSIYCFLKRTAPAPFMSNFDGPNREQFCTKRERSNTPLQALQLLNDVQHFEAARRLGERMILEGGTTARERLTFAYRLVLSRSPSKEELDIAQRALEVHLDRYQKDPTAAAKASSVGESNRISSHPVAEVAAYALAANLILNLDETQTRN